MKNSKKGSATPYLVVLGLIIIVVISMYVKLNWRRFKAEASFGFTVAAVAIAVILILYLMIRHSIRKARKEKEREKARLEKEKLDREREEAGLPPLTLGNGKLELSDFGEAADKAADKLGGFLNKDEKKDE